MKWVYPKKKKVSGSTLYWADLNYFRDTSIFCAILSVINLVIALYCASIGLFPIFMLPAINAFIFLFLAIDLSDFHMFPVKGVLVIENDEFEEVNEKLDAFLETLLPKEAGA